VNDRVIDLREANKQEIRVSITLQLTIRDADGCQPGTQVAPQPLTGQKSAKQKGEKTASKRQKEQEDVIIAANEATKNHVALIALKHRCMLANCKNFKKS
jgi:hypothetical protein